MSHVTNTDFIQRNKRGSRKTDIRKEVVKVLLLVNKATEVVCVSFVLCYCVINVARRRLRLSIQSV